LSLLFVFIDGVGLAANEQQNPMDYKMYQSLNLLTDGQPFAEKAKAVQRCTHLFKGVDACLNVEGLPQSGTGQAALFSGENAPQIAGRHFGPYPHSQTRPLLNSMSLFNRAKSLGISCHFLNAYPDLFFNKMETTNRWTCTTLMAKKAGIPLNSIKDVLKGKAITADLTQQWWSDNLDAEQEIPVISPHRAASRALEAMNKYGLLLYEYYLTDKAGHKQEQAYAHKIFRPLDDFLWSVIKKKSEEDSIVICSDHGNLEDLSTKSHTRNLVPLAVIGPAAAHFQKAESIMDVTPAILNYFSDNHQKHP